jgi:hypothetical protein
MKLSWPKQSYSGDERVDGVYISVDGAGTPGQGVLFHIIVLSW